VDLEATLLAIVSERTGYPIDMLDPDLNLEAELSIDSIKRVEILATLGGRMGLLTGPDVGGDKAMERLAAQKTLRGILAALGDLATDGAHRSAQGEPAQAVGPEPRSDVRVQRGLRRFVIGAEAASAPTAASSLAGTTWAIVTDPGGVAAALARALGERGASAVVVENGSLPLRVDGLVDLSALRPSDVPGRAEKGLFEAAREAIARGATVVCAATPIGAPFGPEPARPRPGVAGVLRTLAREAPITARAVGVDPGEGPSVVAGRIVTEIAIGGGPVEVAYPGGVRHAATVVEAPRAPEGARGASLGPSDVVLITGGARGITARAALALARRYGCKLELLGRSTRPGPEEHALLAELGGASDGAELRRAIIAGGRAREPSAVEALARQVLAAREITETVRRLGEAGSPVTYHACDVRDPAALAAVIQDVVARHGRIDAVVHGAGVLEDRRFVDKTPDSFDRVFDTKVASAHTMLEHLPPGVRWIVLFSSVAGVFGNRGQVDYAAANDALDKLACWHAARRGARVLSVAWGPWASTGMVSPELQREYERRGVGLVDPDEGCEALLWELEGGAATHVVLMNAAPEAMDPKEPVPRSSPDTALAALAVDV
jgi:NAD(P)-dependent dehydrogenase (short-subunit alcohol dehydrogenase family)